MSISRVRARLVASTILSVGLGAAGQAFAADAAKPAETSVGELVVTGTRIPTTTNIESPQPIQIISAQTIDQRGFTNVADALNELPGAGVGITPNGDQNSFGTGRNFINLFNLGSNRTLTLVNGRRFVGANAASLFTGSSPGGQVDLNAIPTAFIERIDIVQATGASVYGSDAISGVINIILKDKFEGVEADAQYGNSSRNDYPDYRFRGEVGHTFLDGKANVALSYEYNKTSELKYTDRPWTAAQYSFANNPLNTSSTDGIPATVLITPRTIPELTPGGLIYKTNSTSLAQLVTVGGAPVQLASDSTLVPYNPGTFFQASVAQGGQGLSLAPLTSLETPLERHVLTFISRFELTPNIRLHGQAFFSRYYSNEPANQPIYNSGLFGGTSGNLAFSINNPFLPASTKAALLAVATPAQAAGTGSFFLSRASTDIVGSNPVIAQTDSYDLSANLEGDFDAADRHFIWNVAVSHGETTGFFSQPSINQTKFAYAVDATKNASGAIVCAVSLTASTDPLAQGCQPLNLFGFNASSKAARDYVTVDFIDNLAIKQTDIEGNFGGELWRLPGGPWSFNVGAEYRKESSAFIPNLNSQNGVGRSAAIPPVSGGYDTKEFYVESRIPIFSPEMGLPAPFLQHADFTGSWRYVSNSLAGHNTAWSVGGNWEVLPGVTLRGSRSQTFRAPAITELFLPPSTSFTTAADPCDKTRINTGPNPASRAANCAAAFQALGLPANFQLTSNVQSFTVQGTTGGNQNLQNEIANSWTYGFVLQPKFIPGFTLAADYVHVDISKAIVNFALASILSTCYDSPTPPPSVCARFTRDNNAQVTGFTAGFVNAGYTRFAGESLTASYAFDVKELPMFQSVDNAGRLGLNLRVFHTRRLQTSVSGTGFDLSDTEGTIGAARWTGQLDLRYALGPFKASWTTHYVGPSLFDRTFTAENRTQLSLAAYYLHDAVISYDFNSHITARVGINNVADSAPPYPTVSPGVYDEIGRFAFIGLNARY